MTDEQISRRRFIVATVTLYTYATALPGPSWLKGSAAWAESKGESSELLTRLARLLFPHDGMADSVYAEVMDGVLSAAAEDSALTAALQSAGTAFDRQGGKPWVSLDERGQIAVLETLQNEAFFTDILNSVRGHFYYNKRVWKHLDYPGPSFKSGGYLHRGFDDIDWLSQAN